MADITIFSNDLRAKFLQQIGDPDDFSDAELKKLATEYVKLSQENGLVGADIDANAALKELTELLNENKDGVKSKDAKATTAKASPEDVQAKISELKAKYNVTAGATDTVLANPSVSALGQALDDGLIEDLSSEGFSKSDIISIISSVFPAAGINANSTGGYSVPYGHDAGAKEIYDKFTQKMNLVDNEERQAALAKIAQINAQITSNNSRLSILKATITRLQKELETTIDECVRESKEIAEDQKEEAARIAKEQLNAYANSDGDMTYDDFKKGLDEKLTALAGEGGAQLARVMSKMFDAERSMSTLSTYIGSVSKIVDDNKQLSTDLASTQEELKEIEESGESDSEASRCDPIGFVSDDTRYDFFVDNDNNGKLSNEQEFLGAQSGWDEMAALDANGDNKVDASEMAGLKVVTTNADGTQVVKDASEVFKDGDSIDLSSYSAKNATMDNGNELLGTFSVDFNGNTITDGYNTMDSLSWLDENYSFSDKDEGINRFSQGNTNSVAALDFDSELEQFQANYVALEGKMQEAWSNIGLDRDEVTKAIKDKVTQENTQQAKDIQAEFERTKKAEEEFAKAQEAQEAEAKAEGNEDDNDPTKKKPDEEAG